MVASDLADPVTALGFWSEFRSADNLDKVGKLEQFGEAWRLGDRIDEFFDLSDFGTGVCDLNFGRYIGASAQSSRGG